MSLFGYVEVVMSIRSLSGDGTSAAEYTSLKFGGEGGGKSRPVHLSESHHHVDSI